MKIKLFIIIAVIFLIMNSIGIVEAEMVDTNISELVRDNFTGQIWHSNVAFFTNQSYSQQLDSISSLNNSYDVNGDGYIDTLTWHIANHSEVNALILNYQLGDEKNRESFMSNFHLTSQEADGNISWTEGLCGRVGTETTYGLFTIHQVYKYHPTWTSPDYVHDPYGPGKVNLTGPVSFTPPLISISGDHIGAWAVADVEYGKSLSIPQPTVSVVVGLLLGKQEIKE